jgi:branched-chain amino acid transport system substrate-binding protein
MRGTLPGGLARRRQNHPVAGRIAVLLSLALCLGGCLGGEDEPAGPAGGPLTVYMSLPRGGLSADEGAAVDAGARLALRRARGRAGGREVRLVRLDSTRGAKGPWDPGQVEANAERAAGDRSAIAYIGELDLGATAVSLPVTNDAQLLQVSPLDSLTSLTRAVPGRAGRGAPVRYYPAGRRSFVRLAPNALEEADMLAARLAVLGARRVALVAEDGVYAVELASQVAARSEGAGSSVVATETLTAEEGSARAGVDALAEARPDAIVYAGTGDRPAAELLAELARRLPATPVLAAGGTLDRQPVPFGAAPERVEAFSPLRPPAGYGRRGRRVLAELRRRGGAAAARPEALYGFEAARLVLDAIEAGGARRAAVVRAGRSPRVRRSPLGRYEIRSTGDTSGRPLALHRLRDGRFMP